MADPIWMEHEETGGRALLPDTLLWRGKGWKPADGPPAEPDLLHDEPGLVPAGDPQVNPDSTPVDAPDAGDPRKQPTPVGEEPVPAPKSSKKSEEQVNG